MLRYGLRSLRDPAAPLHIPLTADRGLWRFLAQFAANCRRSSWDRAVQANVPLNEECLEAFDVLVANGVDAPVTDAPITALFRSARDAEHLLRELRSLADAGQSLSVTELSGGALRAQVPLASQAITAGVNVNGQRFVDPGRFVTALGRAVVDRGATMRTGVVDVSARAPAVVVNRARGAADRRRRGDRHRRVVVAAGGPTACACRCGPAAATRSPCPWTAPSWSRSICRTPGWRARLTTAAFALRAPWSSAARTNRRPGAGRRHRRLRESAAGRRALGRTQRHLGGPAPGHPRRPPPDR